MPITAFPKGVSSFGIPVTGNDIPLTGGKVYWVGNRSGLQAGDGSSPEYPISTINAALAKCVSGQNDIVIILPGHAENIGAADAWSSLVAGTKIIGLGAGDRPAFTWTAATGTVLLDVANVEIMNCGFYMAGSLTSTTAITVAAPMTVSAAGCALRRCFIHMGVDNDQIVTNGIITTAAANEFVLEDNFILSNTSAECTSMIKLVGADNLIMRRNFIAGATGAAGAGVVLFATTASTNIIMEENTIINRKALSQGAVTGLANTTGVSRYDHFAYLDTASLTPWLTSTGGMTFHRPTVTNTAGETGTEVVGTVSA